MFPLYGIQREDVKYILSTFTGTRQEGETIFGASSTFDRIVKHYGRLRENCK